MAAINCTGSAEEALVPVFLRITHWPKSGLPVSLPGLFPHWFYCIASAHESAATARKCYYIHFEIAQIQDLANSNILLMQN